MTYADFDIDIPQGRISGQIATRCPQCAEDRKKKNAKPLSVNLDKGVWLCHHCNWTGGLNKKQYALPKWENNTNLPDSVVEWFAKRNIGQQVLIDMKITAIMTFMPQTEKMEKSICFNYFRNGKLINVKYRTFDES